jgi:hypothetical protein
MLLSVSAALNKVMGFVFAGNLTRGWRPPTGHQCIDEKIRQPLRRIGHFSYVKSLHFLRLFVQE